MRPAVSCTVDVHVERGLHGLTWDSLSGTIQEHPGRIGNRTPFLEVAFLSQLMANIGLAPFRPDRNGVQEVPSSNLGAPTILRPRSVRGFEWLRRLPFVAQAKRRAKSGDQ